MRLACLASWPARRATRFVIRKMPLTLWILDSIRNSDRHILSLFSFHFSFFYFTSIVFFIHLWKHQSNQLHGTSFPWLILFTCFFNKTWIWLALKMSRVFSYSEEIIIKCKFINFGFTGFFFTNTRIWDPYPSPSISIFRVVCVIKGDYLDTLESSVCEKNGSLLDRLKIKLPIFRSGKHFGKFPMGIISINNRCGHPLNHQPIG